VRDGKSSPEVAHAEASELPLSGFGGFLFSTPAKERGVKDETTKLHGNLMIALATEAILVKYFE
jgi:hypothetical protein